MSDCKEVSKVAFLRRPLRCAFSDGKSLLEFGTPINDVDRRRAELGLMTGRFRMLGAVAFPGVMSGRDLRGYILCAAVNGDGKVFIVEEREFVCVDHIVRDGVIKYEGISAWLNECWTKYCQYHYFFAQPWDVFSKYGVQVDKSNFINPKPSFDEVYEFSEDQAVQSLLEKIETRQLVYAAGGCVDSDLRMFFADEKYKSPALHALKVLFSRI